ncbi:hypothetical protein [Mitsuaria sp. GD03876]|uniref:hypothetical protein n=1 Tax=Mitsuaria sp. GD03876 TaxID=2975399 RepID=UPI002449D74C|nr:hypothetical protein [Mitsuaria sp. GD03876]MDH0867502.1 hypothetical protein [Mitsuaria sp. GD03876]
MALIGDTRFAERSSFFNGQRLFASDLQELDDFNRQMRWLHNQSLHQPGIGAGFATTGAKGAREVSIQPGYAIDARGREIVLADAVVQPVPPVAGDDFGAPVFFDLTVSYPTEALEVAETRDGVCGATGGAIRLRETPVFCWVRLGPAPDYLPTDAKLRDAVVNGTQLRLARAQVLNCRLEQPLSLAQRRNARPAAQPYVASGLVAKPAWTMPAAGAGASGFGLQLEAVVDTTSAGFRTMPCYSAQVLGRRDFSFDVGDRDVVRLVDGFVMLLAADKASFKFSMLVPDSLLASLPPGADDPDPQSEDFRKQLLKQVRDEWRIEWIGVEG